MGKVRILVVRLEREDLLRAVGGVEVRVVVTHANLGVEVRDDVGAVVRHELGG